MPTSICHAMKFSISKLFSRWKYLIEMVAAAHAKPASTAHNLGARTPRQFQGSTTSASPANAAITAIH
jgi:hypothetical protein